MSTQHNPARENLSDEELKRKTRRNKAMKPNVSDFKDMQNKCQSFIADIREPNGFTVHIMCKVIDAYASEPLTPRDENGFQLFGLVESCTDPKYDHLMSHVVKVAAMPRQISWSFRPTISLSLLSSEEYQRIMEGRKKS